jgi:hypothetical protein
MGWRDFIASLVDSLAWPAAVVVLVMLLRSQIAGLFDGTLQRLKLGPAGAELEWARTEAVTAVAAVSSNRAAAPGERRDGFDAELAVIEEMTDTVPSVAVQRGFDLVERELRRIVDEQKLEVPYPNPRVDGLIKAAYHGNAITRETGEALRGLLHLRNLTDDDPAGTRTTPDKARDYLVLTRSVLDSLGAETLAEHRR